MRIRLFGRGSFKDAPKSHNNFTFGGSCLKASQPPPKGMIIGILGVVVLNPPPNLKGISTCGGSCDKAALKSPILSTFGGGS